MPSNAPQYRFRGSIQPSASIKRPVRAERPSTGTAGVGVLHLDDVIDSWGGEWGISAREFGAALAELGDVAEIQLHVNSPGGEVYEGISIMNALRRHPARVTAVVDGIAASAASFIAASADELVMARNTELMIHDAWGIALGPASEMRAAAERLDAHSNNIASVYHDKAGGSLDGWRDLMLAETWFSADEAVAAGLADRIEGTEPDPDVRNAFDLGVFAYAGREAAPPPVPVLAADPPPEFDDLAMRHRHKARASALR